MKILNRNKKEKRISKKDEKVNRYRCALEHARAENRTMWQVFSIFLLIHTVFVSFLFRAFANKSIKLYHPIVFVAAIAGLLVCILWWATHSRNRAYFLFRMAQARRAEPPGWNLLARDGENFAKGESIKIGEESYRVPCLGRKLKPYRAIPILICIFIVLYLLVLVLSGPWWN